MISALFVIKNGPYYGLENVDPWDEERDARKYNGPWPVIAHPPCARWGKYWSGGPSHHGKYKLGDDYGCFKSALESVRKWGGVLEHPSGSLAWRKFGLLAPDSNGGWFIADFEGGFTCQVDQGNYGHIAGKSTWLYVFGKKNLPSLNWGKAKRIFKNKRRGIIENLSKKNREKTPEQFRDLLISIASGD